MALLAGATVIAEWSGLTIQSYDVGIRGFDSLWYHLPWAASFAQTGSITGLRFTDVEYLTPFYPATAEMLHGLGIVLLGRDTLSPGINLVWLGLTLLAAYCIGRPRGVGAATTIGAALAMGTTMMDYSQAGAAANDVVAVFFLLAAVALLITEPEHPAARVLAAIAAGLAVGTKLTRARAGARAHRRRGGDRPARPATRDVRAVARPADRRRRLLVRAQPDRGRQPASRGRASRGSCRRPPRRSSSTPAYSVAHYLTTTHFWSALRQSRRSPPGLGRWWWAVLAVAIVGPLLCTLPERRSGRNPAMLRFLPKRSSGCSGSWRCSRSPRT